MKKTKLYLSALLAALLVLTSCSSPNVAIYEIPTPNVEVVPPHEPLTFQDRRYHRPDIEAIQAEMEEVLALAKEKGKKQEVLVGYQSLLAQITAYDEMNSLALVHHQLDLSNAFYEQESQLLETTYPTLDNQMLKVTEAILDSSYRDAFVKQKGQAFLDRYEKRKKLNTPAIEALSAQETKLINEYHKLSTKDYTARIDGKEVALSDLDLSSRKGRTAYQECYKKKNKELGNVYLQLVKLRVDIAKRLGYDKYSEYAYEVLGRDYQQEEAKAFEQQVLKYIAPLQKAMIAKYQRKITAVDTSKQQVEQGFPVLEEAVAKEFPEAMQEALAYMKKYHLYSINNDKNMVHAGYTTLIKDAPFLFINTEDYQNPQTLIHEFGHYYNFYLMGELHWNDGNNLDLAEVHSQGLELLMVPYYAKLYGEDAQIMEVKGISTLLNNLLQGCAEDEFQRTVYEHPEMTLDEVNELHGTIWKRYLGKDVLYEWVDIHHNFETPFYYISYATSAASTLELWMINEQDRSSALGAYRNLTQQTINVPYLAALSSAGFSNPFTTDLIRTIGKEVRKKYL